MTEMREAERAYSVDDAASVKGVSADIIRRAIHATEGPFIRAKKIGPRYRIAASELDRWFDSLTDA